MTTRASVTSRTLALSPLGAVRRAHVEVPVAEDELFRRLGVGARRCDLGDAGLYLAEELVAWNRYLGPREKRSMALGVLALMLAVRSGSTRLPLEPRGPGAELVAGVIRAAGLDGEVAVREVMKDLRNLATGFHGVVGPPRLEGAVSPLVVDDDALYPQRLWWLEARLAGHLATRRGRALMARAEAEAVVAATRDDKLSDEQAEAAVVALTASLSVITGGPGTGKTATLAAIVAALRAAGLADGDIALAAPTGKAANRMGESVRARLGAGVAIPAMTLHRVLRSQPGGGFHHGEGNPLPFAAVVVDEASMIDLALMERLVAALRTDARLVLIGDPDQLPSVEAGQVLTDLLGASADADADAALAGTARLTRSYRVDSGDAGKAILAAAAAVLTGDAKKLGPGRGERLATTRARPADVAGTGVEFVAADAAGALAFVDHWWRRRWARLGELSRRAFRRVGRGWHSDDAEALAELLSAHEASRLLAVTRSGTTGSVGISARCHAMVLAEATVEGAPEFLPGEPVIQTKNDYVRGLWNGDQGVVARVVDEDGQQHYRVVFRRVVEVIGDDGVVTREDQLVPFPVDALRGGLELAWAMTVHKSQGSEFGQAVLLLPGDGDVPILSRELVYTALTRARTSAVVVGDAAVLAEGAARKAVRSTGLRARLAR